MIHACILNLRAQGSITAAQAQLYIDTFDELSANLRSSMSAAAAAAAATQQTMAAAQAAILRRQRLAGLRYHARRDIVQQLQRLDGDGVELDVAIPALFDFDERATGMSNVEGRRKAVLGKAHGMIADLLETFDRDVLGRMREPARLENVVREAFGKSTGDAAAQQMAKAWGEAAEYLRKRFNLAGGDIGRIQNWGLPQVHDAVKVKAAGFAEWRASILPMLDVGRMVNHATGRPFTGAQLNRKLRETYDSIITSGWDDRTLGTAGAGSLANRRAEHRFLIFRDPDQWLDYQARFGAGDTRGDPGAIFDVMMGHMDGMARDIAALEILGPEPQQTVRWLSNMLDKAAATDAITNGRVLTVESKANVAKYQMQTMWGLFNGELTRPVNAQLARSFSAARSLQTAAKLGGAAISAVTDVGFQMTTRAFNGLPVAKALGDYVQWMAPRVKAGERAVAIRSGLLAEEAASRMATLHRYADEFNTPAWASRLASGVLRVTGLSRWTQVGKWLFGMEFMGSVGDNAGKAFADIDAPLRQAFERHGIGAADWDAIRQTPLHQAQNGGGLLRPDEVRTNPAIPAADRERLSDLLLEMIQTETRYAVPDAGLRARAVTTAGVRPGTVMGEFVRSAMQFKAFPVSILFTHLTRAVHGRGALSRAQYAAHVMIATTLFGALAAQTKSLLAGRDPRPMDDPRFWGAAAVQGGGLGIMGDFLFSDQNRMGGGFAATLAGPLAGTLEGFGKLTMGNIQQAADGDDSNVGRETVRFLRANTPGSSIWYARLAMDRLIWGEMQRMADPDFDAANRRMIRRAEDELNAPYWWAPGDPAPERAPDISNVFEGESE
jgi:hypothetical protein